MKHSSKRRRSKAVLSDIDPRSTERNHYIQTLVWASTKQTTGWSILDVLLPADILGEETTLFLYLRRVKGFGTLAYAPMWPDVFDEKTLPRIKEVLAPLLARHKVFLVRFEPAMPSSKIDKHVLNKEGFKQVDDHIQYLSTIYLDLTKSEDTLFAELHKTARNETRKAEKAGVVFEELDITPDNLQLLTDVVGGTKDRKQFYLRKTSFLNSYWAAYGKCGQGRLFAARYNSEVLCMAYVVVNGATAFYKDAGSAYSKETANLYGPTFMQWKIIQTLKKDGVQLYDLCGALAHGKESETDPLWKVYRFKRKFSQELTCYPGFIDWPQKKGAYKRWLKTEKFITRGYRKLTGEVWY